MRFTTLTFICFLVYPSLAAAEEKPKEIITRAIQALGGMEKVAQDPAIYRKIKGKFHQGADFPFTGELYNHGSSRVRYVMNLLVGGNKITAIQVTNGDKTWMRTNDSTQEVQGDLRERMIQSKHVDRVSGLVALLKDKGFTLSMLPESKVEDRPALGIKVAFQGQPDVFLFFDKVNGLPVKYEYKTNLGTPNKQDMTYGVVFKDYRTEDEDPGVEEEKALKDAKLPVDGPALLGHIRKQTSTPAVHAEIKKLIRLLGSESFQARRKSAAALIARGIPAMPFLHEALKDPDAEIVQRAKDCLQKIKAEGAIQTLTPAVRLAGLRNPPGAVDALLDFLPSAPTPALADEVKAALFAIAERSKVPDKALVKALEDKDPERRAVAAAALGRDGGAYRNKPGRRCYFPGLKLALTHVYYQDGKLLMELGTTECRFYNKLDDALFAKP